MGQDSYCYYVTGKTSDFFIGANHMLNLLLELEYFKMLICIVKLVAVAIFGYAMIMIWAPIFLLIFLISIPIHLIFELYHYWWKAETAEVSRLAHVG